MLFNTYPPGAVISVIVIVSGFDISVIFIPFIAIFPLELVVYGAVCPPFILILNTAFAKTFLFDESCFNSSRL